MMCKLSKEEFYEALVLLAEQVLPEELGLPEDNTLLSHRLYFFLVLLFEKLSAAKAIKSTFIAPSEDKALKYIKRLQDSHVLLTVPSQGVDPINTEACFMWSRLVAKDNSTARLAEHEDHD